MTRKAFLLGLSFAGVSLYGIHGASAQFLPGNVWPNPGLSTVAPAGVDQVYSFYNNPAGPNVTGDTNPRPNGWHRGNGDFGVTTAPQFCFYNTPGNSAGEGAAPPGNSDGYALEVNDTVGNNSGEWFSDWNALPTGVVANPGTPVDVRFFYELTNLASTQRPTDQFRVTANFGDAVSDDIATGDPNNLGHTDYTWTIPGTADVTTWTEVDETLVPPVGSESMRITVDSGGSSAATGQIWVSDISVAAPVPEPTCIAGIITGSMLLLARRRRAQQP
jgi:hypothetical protein